MPQPGTHIVVAHNANSELCGAAAVSTEVDLASLNAHFDLAAYDGLLHSEQYEILLKHAQQKLQQEVSTDPATSQEKSTEKGQTVEGAVAGAEAAAESSAAGSGNASEDADSSTDPAALHAAFASAIAAAAAAAEREAGALASNCIALTMLAAHDDARDSTNSRRSSIASSPHATECVAKLLAAAFAEHPDADWLIAALPFEFAPPAGLQHCTGMAPVVLSQFGSKLYLIHRYVLLRLTTDSAA